MDIKEFRRRLINYYVHPELFLVPVKKKEETYQITIHKVTPYFYDIKRHIFSKKSYASIKGSIIVLNSEGDPVYISDPPNVYNSNYDQRSVYLSLPRGKYRIKYLFCNENFNDEFEEFEVAENKEIFLYTNPLPPILNRQKIVSYESDMEIFIEGGMPNTEIDAKAYTAALSETYIDGVESLISHQLRPLNNVVLAVTKNAATTNRYTEMARYGTGGGIRLDGTLKYFKGDFHFKHVKLGMYNTSNEYVAGFRNIYPERYSKFNIKINIPGYMNLEFSADDFNNQDFLLYGGSRITRLSDALGSSSPNFINSVSLYRQQINDFRIVMNTYSRGWFQESTLYKTVTPVPPGQDTNPQTILNPSVVRYTLNKKSYVENIIDELEIEKGPVNGYTSNGLYYKDYFLDLTNISGSGYGSVISTSVDYNRYYTYYDPINNIKYNNARVEPPDVTYPSNYFSCNYSNELTVNVEDSDIIYRYYLGRSSAYETSPDDIYLYYIGYRQIDNWKEAHPSGTILEYNECRLPEIDENEVPDLSLIVECKTKLTTILNGFFSLPVLQLCVNDVLMSSACYLDDEKTFYKVYRRCTPTFSKDYNLYYKEENT